MLELDDVGQLLVDIDAGDGVPQGPQVRHHSLLAQKVDLGLLTLQSHVGDGLGEIVYFLAV